MSAGSEVDERAAMSEIIKIAAELASGAPLKACADLLGMERITRQRLARAITQDDETCRLLAIRLRKAWGTLSASCADRASAAPTEGVEPAEPIGEVVDIRKVGWAEIPTVHWETFPLVGTKLYAAPTRPAAPDAVEALRELVEAMVDCRTPGDAPVDRFYEVFRRARSVLQQIGMSGQ